MTYLFVGGLALLAALALFNVLRGVDRGRLMRSLRWLVGGLAGLLALGLLLLRRIDLALFLGAAAISILRTGRLGPISFDGPPADQGNISRVQSYRFAMKLDHDTGAVSGRVLNGDFAGMDLLDLGEQDTRILLDQVQGDADSLSLIESWLDANRAGWREWFAQQDATAGQGSGPASALDEAYDVLGLKPGATPEEIRAAHRELMKSVHPDHGGSSFLAAKINQARDVLLGL